MFRHEGPARSERKNRVLAAYLALIGGYVNSAGFVLLGTFTSHATGHVGHFADSLIQGAHSAAMDAVSLVGAFWGGATLASVLLESSYFRSRPAAYGTALALEAALLCIARWGHASPHHPASKLYASTPALVCAAMGLQNSLVTRLSGAVVRTTHLTGVITDLGIEAARWLRWWRAALAQRLGVTLVLGDAERPVASRLRILLTIVAAFSAGSVAGACATCYHPERSLFLPAGGLLLASLYAFASRSKHG